MKLKSLQVLTIHTVNVMPNAVSAKSNEQFNFMIMKKLCLLFVIAYLFLASCEKSITEIEYSDKIHSWIQDSRMQYDNALIMNSHSTNENLYLMGFYDYTKISLTETNRYSLQFEYPIDNKFPITDNYYVAANKEKDYIVIVSNDLPHADWSRKTIFIKNLDNLFYEFEFDYYSNGECIAVSENDYFLAPYRTAENNALSNMPKLLMVGLDVKKNENDISIDTLNTKLIELGDAGAYNSIYSIKSIKDKFLIACGNKTYLLDTSGNISIAYNGIIERYLIHDGLYYAVAWPFSENNFLQSSDNGKTWNEIGKIPNDFSLLNYKSIGDSLIGFYKSQLFSIKITENKISSRELDNDGLIGKEITSLSSFTDSLIFVTTLNGLFYNNKQDFFNDKVE